MENSKRMRLFVEDLVAHGLAAAITIGFFGVIIYSISGKVNLSDPTASSMIGLVIGYVSSSLNAVLSRYFVTGMESREDAPAGTPASTNGTKERPVEGPPEGR